VARVSEFVDAVIVETVVVVMMNIIIMDVVSRRRVTATPSRAPHQRGQRTPPKREKTRT
jgi:hypothetical protein